jgi:hypothetical protein
LALLWYHNNVLSSIERFLSHLLGNLDCMTSKSQNMIFYRMSWLTSHDTCHFNWQIDCFNAKRGPLPFFLCKKRKNAPINNFTALLQKTASNSNSGAIFFADTVHLASGSARIGTDVKLFVIPVSYRYWFHSYTLLSVPVGRLFFKKNTPRLRIRMHRYRC